MVARSWGLTRSAPSDVITASLVDISLPPLRFLITVLIAGVNSWLAPCHHNIRSILYAPRVAPPCTGSARGKGRRLSFVIPNYEKEVTRSLWYSTMGVLFDARPPGNDHRIRWTANTVSVCSSTEPLPRYPNHHGSWMQGGWTVGPRSIGVSLNSLGRRNFSPRSLSF